jgi:hypothetical protein
MEKIQSLDAHKSICYKKPDGAGPKAGEGAGFIEEGRFYRGGVFIEEGSFL